MSIIFNTLKKVKSQSPDEPGGPQSLVEKKREVYSLPRLLSSPFMLLVFLLAGTGLFYGGFYLKENIERDRVAGISDTVRPGSQTSDARPPSPPEKKKDYTFMAPREVKAQQLAGSPVPPGKNRKDPFPAPPQPESITSGPDTAIPPESPNPIPGMKESSESRENGRADAGLKFLPRQEPRRELMGKGNDEQDDSPPRAVGALSVPVNLNADLSEEQTTDPRETYLARAEPPALFNNRGDGETGPVNADRRSTSILLHPTIDEVSNGSSQRSREDALLRETTEIQRVQAAKVRKCSEIARIVTRLETSIRNADDKKAGFLVDELTQLKGDDNTYIIKFKAFMLVQKGEFASAAPLLSSVLEKNKNDLEAGINMAIVEANTGQIEAAKTRLAKLSRTYPSNSLVPDILERLE